MNSKAWGGSSGQITASWQHGWRGCSEVGDRAWTLPDLDPDTRTLGFGRCHQPYWRLCWWARFGKLPAREGGGAPMSSLAMFTMHCSVAWWAQARRYPWVLLFGVECGLGADFAEAGARKFGGVGFSPLASACLQQQHVDERLWGRRLQTFTSS